MIENSERKSSSLQDKEKALLDLSDEEKTDLKKDRSLDGDLEEVVSKPIEVEGKNKKSSTMKGKNEGTSPAVLDAHIKRIITRAYELKATEVHIDELQDNARIRYRVDGKLVKEDLNEPVKHDVLTNRIKVMAEFFMRDKQMIQKGDILYSLDSGEKITINVNALPTFCGDLIVLKFANEKKNFKIVDLGMTYEDIRTVGRILEKKSGLVIVGGLAGSGRTTTIYALLNKLVTNEVDIVHIENKVYEKVEGVSQVSLKDYKNISTNEIVSSVADFDVDVIVVDVDVDGELMRKLVNLSLGGKLIIVTSYFPTAFDTILGLTSLGIEPYTIAAALEGIMCQQLVRKLCPACKNQKVEDYTDTPCEICSGSGYYGKLAVFEMFKMNKDYWQLILRKEESESLKKFLEKERCSFVNNAKRLIDSSLTGIEEIVRLGIEPRLLK